ncbi:MAG: Arc family DNA-binding protein [Methylocystis sp.]|nr:Arc family DNA-binding protein [Methylocystis sp.]
MPVTLSIKNAPDEVVAKLKARAAHNHRSLQGELMAIVTEAAARSPPAKLEDFWGFAKEIGLESPSEAVEIVREMRDSRNT